MLTIESLKEYGADVDAGLTRCMGRQDFYLRLVKMEMADKNFSALDQAIENRDVKAAFEAAHALKGAVGNLSLTPILAPVSEMTELLRSAETMPDVQDLRQRISAAHERLKQLAQ